MKKNIKVIIAFILGGIIFSGITAFAAIKFQANEIGYGSGTVSDALDELYATKGEGVQVATLTTQGATYTMQNDGYVIGTMTHTGNAGAILYFGTAEIEDNIAFVAPNTNSALHVSVYAPKNTILHTRSSYGTYNLTVYEWK